jgi:tetratricopeptide (TPR) repeat protein
MRHNGSNRRWAAWLAAVFLVSSFGAPAWAGICFTSGRVYVQQKVYDKACWYLECARREDPNNIDIYNLLAYARWQQKEYISAGAAIEIGLKLANADAKKNKKKIEELNQTRHALNVDLYNKGIGAFNKAGQPSFQDERTQGDPNSRQGKIEAQYGAPPYFSIVIEAGRVQEFWYYPDKGLGFHFMPDGAEPIELKYKPYTGLGKPEEAVQDTTVFGPYQGGSYFGEAAYYFELGSYVDPGSVDTYANLSFVFGVLGRAEDAMRAAKRGLEIDPKNERLTKNLRAAAMSTGNRFYSSGEYLAAVKAFQNAMQVDQGSTIIYMDRIANAWYNHAQKLPQGSDRTAAFDSAAVAFQGLLDVVPADSVSIRENALYNASVIYNNLGNYAKAAEVLEKAVQLFPNNKEMASLLGQMKFQANDFAAAATVLHRAVELDPADPVPHQFLFLTLQKLGKTDDSFGEYLLYKSLSEGTPKRPNQIKIWVDAADNRLGAGNDLNGVKAAEGYPEEVRMFTEENKLFEAWFYWSKGKSYTFMEGKKISKSVFPPKKVG